MRSTDRGSSHSLTDRPALLTDALHAAARNTRGSGRLLCGDGSASYAELELLSNRLAARLLHYGIRPADRIIIGLPNSAEFFIACFAAWKIRAIAVPVDPTIRPVNLQQIIEATVPRVLVADENFAARVLKLDCVSCFRALFLRDYDPGSLSPTHLPAESLAELFCSDDELPELLSGARPDDVVTINFTSGSTGTPKGVMHTHRSCIACAAYTRDFLHLSSSDLTSIPLPFHHVLAFRRVLTCILANSSVAVSSDIFAAMRMIPRLRPSGLVLVPAACNIMIEKFGKFLRGHPGILRYLEIGSEPVSPERLEALHDLLPGTKIHLTYGLTEGRVGYLHPSASGRLNRLPGSNHGLEIRVVDAAGKPVPPGDTGEILLQGEGLFCGYWGESLSARDRIAVSGFRTGDMGRPDSEGNVELLGRVDDILKIGGRKINPREIEKVVNAHPAVSESFIVGIPDPKGVLEMQLHAYVVLKPRASLNHVELEAFCSRRLEPFKIPARFHYRNSFPKTALGKIQRHQIVQRALGQPSAD